MVALCTFAQGGGDVSVGMDYYVVKVVPIKINFDPVFQCTRP